MKRVTCLFFALCLLLLSDGVCASSASFLRNHLTGFSGAHHAFLTRESSQSVDDIVSRTLAIRGGAKKGTKKSVSTSSGKKKAKSTSSATTKAKKKSKKAKKKVKRLF